MLNIETVFTNPILKRSNNLLRVRLWFYTFAYIHLVSVASWLLTIDFSKFDDPSIRQYQSTRWKLITAWFNLFSLVYFPTCFYCDWRELRGDVRRRHVKFLNQFRNLCFSSILFPTTAFGDILFWRVWNKDRELIAPPNIDDIVPFWSQHCMHTVSLVVMLLDLVLVPRERPKSVVPGIIILSTFLGSYTFVCVQSYMQGEYIYPGLKLFTGHKFFVLVTYVFIENFFYYFSQWLIIDMVWGQTQKNMCKQRILMLGYLMVNGGLQF
ncbi:androgen-dependent TFPI-regulating protein [Manduca sexta]|uniref:Androgen-dependent TFPI-regulating protein n=1 Tax=Manduca sexta TaxID=7130 RepID=A0A922CUI5_MANSE|nr:androgen-dependent TFPI-regulating protein [Manduca sexta]KAG6458448.1 hypothetical protein O3G_MSEX010870 [Manduca sexta]